MEIHLRLTAAQIDRLDTIAKKYALNRQQTIRFLIGAADPGEAYASKQGAR